MAYYQSNMHMVETLVTFTEQQHWSSCLRSNSIDEGTDTNPFMLTLQPNYSVPSHLLHPNLQYSQTQKQRGQVLDIEGPLDRIMINSLPNKFLKKLHWYIYFTYTIQRRFSNIKLYSILTCEKLPSHIYWNSNQTSFTICFEADLVHKYLPQIFQFFSINSVVKLLTK
jgi:hypothetical protein